MLVCSIARAQKYVRCVLTLFHTRCREISLLRELCQHPCVVALHDIQYANTDVLYMVFEYMDQVCPCFSCDHKGVFLSGGRSRGVRGLSLWVIFRAVACGATGRRLALCASMLQPVVATPRMLLVATQS